MKISVILPTFNRSQYLPLALDSIFGQSFRDFEVIVVDDGSTDDTRQVVSKYATQVEYIYQENQGRGAARNMGVEHARGEYIAFLDSDDLWHPDHLERLMAFFGKNSDSVFVHGPVDVIGEGGLKDLESTQKMMILFEKAKQRGYSYKNLLGSCLIFTSATLVKKSLFAMVGPFDRALRILEDLDWYLRVAQRYRIGYLDGPPVASYRLHKGNAFRAGDQEVLDTYVCIFSRHLEEIPGFPRDRIAMSQAHVSLSFCYSGLNQPDRSRRHIVRAFTLSPKPVLNRRVAVRFLKSFL
jgi:glycosyltransferase involved in cell wall biosynthesis